MSGMRANFEPGILGRSILSWEKTDSNCWLRMSAFLTFSETSSPLPRRDGNAKGVPFQTLNEVQWGPKFEWSVYKPRTPKNGCSPPGNTLQTFWNLSSRQNWTFCFKFLFNLCNVLSPLSDDNRVRSGTSSGMILATICSFCGSRSQIQELRGSFCCHIPGYLTGCYNIGIFSQDPRLFFNCTVIHSIS